ncbi:hypothetical protein LIA77_09856 [Sarocladium implicatum]|nr:hypothetical protein LIA77_09856 [Sarocladium implicatum]
MKNPRGAITCGRKKKGPPREMPRYWGEIAREPRDSQEQRSRKGEPVSSGVDCEMNKGKAGENKGGLPSEWQFNDYRRSNLGGSTFCRKDQLAPLHDDGMGDSGMVNCPFFAPGPMGILIQGRWMAFLV